MKNGWEWITSRILVVIQYITFYNFPKSLLETYLPSILFFGIKLKFNVSLNVPADFNIQPTTKGNT
jgi:hypothetical protein